MPDHHVSSTQSKTSNLRLGDVDVIRPGQIVIRSEETHPFTHDIQDSSAQFETLPFCFGVLTFVMLKGVSPHFQPVAPADVTTPEGHLARAREAATG